MTRPSALQERTTTIIRVGLVGLGRAGWNLHRPALTRLASKYEIAAVADTDRTRVAEAVAQLGCVGCADVADLVALPTVDLVVLCVPSVSHAQLATTALWHGKHVLVEKPIATSLTELDDMVAASRTAGRRLFGSQNRRYTADFLAVRELIESGRLGELHEIKVSWRSFRRRWDWQTVRSCGGGALLNDGSHVIDQLLSLGDSAEWRWCGDARRTALAVGDAEDQFNVLLTAASKPLLQAVLSYASAFPEPVWTVNGTYGALTGDDRTIRLRHVEPGSLSVRVARTGSPTSRGYDREDYEWTEVVHDVAEEYVRSHERMYEDLHLAVTADEPSPLDAPNLRTLMTILDHLRSQ